MAAIAVTCVSPILPQRTHRKPNQGRQDNKDNNVSKQRIHKAHTFAASFPERRLSPSGTLRNSR